MEDAGLKSCWPFGETDSVVRQAASSVEFRHITNLFPTASKEAQVSQQYEGLEVSEG